MKTLLKVLLGFVVGGTVGFLAGDRFGYARKEDEIDRASEPCRDRLGEEAASAMRKYRGDISSVEGLDEILRKPATDEDDVPPMVTAEEIVIDVDIDVHTYTGTPVAKPVLKAETTFTPEFHPTQMAVEIITEEEFNHNIDGYDQQFLIYYEEDEVLFNESDQQVIENPDDVVGIGTLFGFGGDPNNPVTTIYVKNETFGTLFRIDSIDAAFVDESGVTPGPSEEDDGDEDYDEGDLD